MTTMIGDWLGIDGRQLARLPAEVRYALLARACAHLILLSVAYSMGGPVVAGMLYATRCGVVRLGPDGGVQVWSGP